MKYACGKINKDVLAIKINGNCAIKCYLKYFFWESSLNFLCNEADLLYIFLKLKGIQNSALQQLHQISPFIISWDLKQFCCYGNRQTGSCMQIFVALSYFSSIPYAMYLSLSLSLVCICGHNCHLKSFVSVFSSHSALPKHKSKLNGIHKSINRTIDR